MSNTTDIDHWRKKIKCWTFPLQSISYINHMKNHIFASEQFYRKSLHSASSLGDSKSIHQITGTKIVNTVMYGIIIFRMLHITPILFTRTIAYYMVTWTKPNITWIQIHDFKIIPHCLSINVAKCQITTSNEPLLFQWTCAFGEKHTTQTEIECGTIP